MTVDQTARPLRIPPHYGLYAEEKGIFETLKQMLQNVIINRPSDPLQHMIDWLDQDTQDLPSIIIQGRFGSGRHSIGKELAQKLRCTLVLPENLAEEDSTGDGDRARDLVTQGRNIPDDLMIKLIKNRVTSPDAVKRGWVLVGFPETGVQAHMLQQAAVLAKHYINLQIPDEVVMERAKGKRVDPETGNIYHITFDYPSDVDTEKRLISPPNCEKEDYLVDQLIKYHRNSGALETSYEPFFSQVNADQPKADVMMQVVNIISRKQRSAAPHTPRIILLGPRGAGKSVQSALIAKKYRIVNVKIDDLVKTHVAGETNIGLTLKPYYENNKEIPDNLLFKLLDERLGQLDCVANGWVLNGFPKNGSQAERMERLGYKANRVLMMDIPTDSIIERVCQRSIDPLTGESYHTLYKPAPTVEVKERLRIHPRDEEAEVQLELNEFHANKEDLVDFFQMSDNRLQIVNADQDTHSVFETIESMICNPIPAKV
ncbi:adenylate kinase 8-like [Convolutriloba macropyga]|uniref:adenylate kinase 8-like n=1 Tax=Convolutriloba macropyga TaxID=536237 RepID=UPI003F52297C